ncbi:MAG: hypothetical protein ABF286_03535 [Polaribacter sp.]
MSIKSVFFSLFLVAIITESTAQNKKSEWVIGTSFALAKFTDFQGTILGGSFINQSPRINISKYLFKSFTADVGFSTAIFDTQKYTTFDAVLRYDFGTSMHNVVPYVVIGGSFVSALETTPTLNLGAGNTFWVKENYGINVQFLYKYSEDRFESQYSHFYPSIGLVYSFKARNLNPRLWHMNN